MPDHLSRRLTGQGIEARWLTIEITESGAMEDTARTLDILTRFRLKRLGLSLDDFGTGYSSLVELARMPFNEIKIDRSLIVELTQSNGADLIVHTIVGLAHGLGLSVCAEGIETEAALAQVAQHGCERVQGYLVAKPLPPEELPAFVSRWNGLGGVWTRLPPGPGPAPAAS